MAKNSSKTVTGRVLHDPVKDKLRPIFPLDLSKIKTIDDLVRAMGDTAYTARQIGDAADVLEAMARDKDCFVVMTLAGALTVGTEVTLSFRSSPENPAERTVRGKVVRFEPHKNDGGGAWPHRIAIEFSEVLPELESVFESWEMPPR